jgi:hypothetical protein
VDGPAGLVACRLPVRPGMRQQQQQFNHTKAIISTDYRDGDGHIRLSEPNRRCNGLYQLKQNTPGPGALQSALAQG